MLNQIHCENCTETMARMPSDFLDLTVTSPPYDDLRVYKGYEFDFPKVAESLYRVTKDGGVVVWVVNDRTVDGDETGTSFRHALTFKAAGFKLWDTMIWEKTNPLPVDGRIPRYTPAFEFMFVMVKGKEPKTFNPVRVPCKEKGAIAHNNYPARRKNGNKSNERVVSKTVAVRDYRIHSNIWPMASNDTNELKREHPATYPDILAINHILSWSNENDLVYDPFMGSGTTAIAARLLGRNYLGSEISDEYVALARKRIEKETAMPLFDEAVLTPCVKQK